MNVMDVRSSHEEGFLISLSSGINGNYVSSSCTSWLVQGFARARGVHKTFHGTMLIRSIENQAPLPAFIQNSAFWRRKLHRVKEIV